MSDENSSKPSLRHIIGVVDRVERNGFALVHEVNEKKSGFFNADTIESGNATVVRPGMQFKMGVVDKDGLFVVKTLDNN